MTDGLKTRVIEDDAGLRAIEPEWRALWERCPAATAFQSPDWLMPWWHAFRPGRLRTLAVFVGDRLAGLAPIYLETGALGRRLLPLGISISDRTDVLVDPAMPDAGAALVRAAEAWDDWDEWVFEELTDEAMARTLPCPASCRVIDETQSAQPGLSLEGERDDIGLPKTIPAKRRRTVRRGIRTAEQMGGWRVEQVYGNADAFLDILHRVHAARWQARGEPGVLADDRVNAFHGESLPKLLARRQAMAMHMAIGGQPACAFYGLRWGDVLAAYVVGFDPRFAAASPGVILMGRTMAEGIEEGAARFEFLRGREAHKYLWGASDRWTIRRSFRRKR